MASVAFHLCAVVSLVLIIVPLVAQQGTNKAIFTLYFKRPIIKLPVK